MTKENIDKVIIEGGFHRRDEVYLYSLLSLQLVAGMVVIPGVAVKADDKKLIGVTMPTKDLQRRNHDGENMKKELEAAGYEEDLQYASNDVSTQVSQLENQVANGCDLLVVASIDGSSLGEPLKQAKEAGIPVISYDRLLMNSDAVTTCSNSVCPDLTTSLPSSMYF